MKKFALLAALICLGFTGCDKKDAPKTGGSGASAAPKSTSTPSGSSASSATPPKVAPTGAGTGS